MKYRLIKEYPESPKLGTKVPKSKILQDFFYNSDIDFGIMTPEKYPEFWEKVVEKPLFTTEDGVDIFEGDTYYKVVNESFQLLIMKNASKGESLKSKVFSIKEKAEEYIILNKPCLSINEIRSCIDETEINFDDEHELNYQLIKLAKSKLQ